MSETVETYNVPRGAAYLTSQQLTIYLTYFLSYLAIARILTREEIGTVSLLAATQAVFITLTTMALPATATRYISSHIGRQQREEAGAVAKTILRLTLTTGSMGTFLSITLATFASQQITGSLDAAVPLAIVFLSGFLLDLLLLYSAFFLGLGRYPESLYQNLVNVTVSRTTGIILAVLALRVTGIILGWLIGAATALLLSYYLWHHQLPAKKSYPKVPLLAFSLPLFIASLLTLTQQWGDIAILQNRLGQLGTTGAYYLIVSSTGFLSILWTPVASALYPAMSADHSAGGPRALSARLNSALRLTNLAVLPLAASVAAIAPTAITLAYGSAYRAESLPFAILALTTVLTAEGAILASALQALGRTLEVLLVTFLATFFQLLTVFLTAVYFGPLAGAIGRTIMSFSTVALAYWVLRRYVQTPPYTGLSKAAVLALGVSLPLALADQLLMRYGVREIITLAALFAVFAISFIAVSRELRIFHPGDFTILKDALPRRLQPFLRRMEQVLITKPAKPTENL